MDTTKILTPTELLTNRSWTEFLKSLSVGETAWRIENYRDFISLRTTASILSNKEGATLKYRLLQDKNDKTIYRIKVEEKQDGVQ